MATKKRPRKTRGKSSFSDAEKNVGSAWGDFGADVLAVRRLQADLLTAGQYDGPIDGVPSLHLENAVRAFQRDFGLSVTGKPTRVDFLRLLAAHTDSLRRTGWVTLLQWNDKGEYIRGLEQANIKLKQRMVAFHATGLARAQEKLANSPGDETAAKAVEEAAEHLYKWRKRLVEELREEPEEAAAVEVAIPEDPEPPDDSRDEREQFAKDIKSQFEAWNKTHDCCGLDACTLAAQWMLESNWGRSKLTKKTKNLGNIKGIGPAGSVDKDAWEVDPQGNGYSEKSSFRKYNSFPEFYADYCKLICKDKRYKDARGKKGRAYFVELKKAGYATDPNYVSTVMGIYNQLWGD
jgi:flagellum-specific peptidoglycan hydrolase FlgJ